MAASTVTQASDTLTLTSHRVVNTCSGEDRWLISASIGEVFDSDSLMSFDITIGYDTAFLQPTDGLFTGTLADQMKFGDISPAANFRVPGEMRVSAFTITRNVKGKQPLFAVSGTYKRGCVWSDSLTLPWNPEFNEEYKKWVKVFNSTTIEAKPFPVQSPIQGVVEQTADLNFGTVDTAASVQIVLDLGQVSGRVSRLSVRLSDTSTATISGYRWESNVTAETVETSDSTLIISFKSAASRDTLWVDLNRSQANKTNFDTLEAHVSIQDSCTCLIPGVSGQTVVRKDSIPVSTAIDFDESSQKDVLVTSDKIIIEDVHGNLLGARIFDLLGRCLIDQIIVNPRLIEIPIVQLQPGVYLLTMVSPKGFTTQFFQR